MWRGLVSLAIARNSLAHQTAKQESEQNNIRVPGTSRPSASVWLTCHACAGTKTCDPSGSVTTSSTVAHPHSAQVRLVGSGIPAVCPAGRAGASRQGGGYLASTASSVALLSVPGASPDDEYTKVSSWVRPTANRAMLVDTVEQ